MAGFVEINFSPETKTLRQFGLIALVGFGLLALAAYYERAIFSFGLGGARVPVAVTLGSLGALSALFSLVYPPGNRPIFVGISVLTFPIGLVLSFVIMGVLFFGVFGVVGIIMRLAGRDPMNRAYEPKTESYWSTPRADRDPASYFRQF